MSTEKKEAIWWCVLLALAVCALLSGCSVDMRFKGTAGKDVTRSVYALTDAQRLELARAGVLNVIE